MDTFTKQALQIASPYIRFSDLRKLFLLDSTFEKELKTSQEYYYSRLCRMLNKDVVVERKARSWEDMYNRFPLEVFNPITALIDGFDTCFDIWSDTNKLTDIQTDRIVNHAYLSDRPELFVVVGVEKYFCCKEVLYNGNRSFFYSIVIETNAMKVFDAYADLCIKFLSNIFEGRLAVDFIIEAIDRQRYEMAYILLEHFLKYAPKPVVPYTIKSNFEGSKLLRHAILYNPEGAKTILDIIISKHQTNIDSLYREGKYDELSIEISERLDCAFTNPKSHHIMDLIHTFLPKGKNYDNDLTLLKYLKSTKYRGLTNIGSFLSCGYYRCMRFYTKSYYEEGYGVFTDMYDFNLKYLQNAIFLQSRGCSFGKTTSGLNMKLFSRKSRKKVSKDEIQQMIPLLIQFLSGISQPDSFYFIISMLSVNFQEVFFALTRDPKGIQFLENGNSRRQYIELEHLLQER